LDLKSVRLIAFGALLINVIGWGTAPVFVRSLAEAYDPFTQSFARYASSSFFMAAICMIWYRKQFWHALFNSRALIGLAMLNALGQILWTTGCYGTDAVVAQLIVKISVVMVVVLSFVLFREERAVIRSPLYILGTLMSFLGVAAVLVTDPASLTPRLDGYAVILIVTALTWSVYAVWSKHIVTYIAPVPLFTVVSVHSTIALGIIAFNFGSPATILHVGPSIAFLTFISGVIPIAIAHVAFHYAQHRLGAAFCSSVNLINPFVTYCFAMLFLPNEILNANQWIGAAILLTGIAAILYTEQRLQRQNNGAQ
jgi:drug/metabolite transporter (DMT)-like permease